MGKKLLRLLGALFAVALLASACGSNDASTEAAIAQQATNETADEAAAQDASATNDEMSETDEGDEASHSDDDDEHSHGEEVLEVDADAPIPSVEIALSPTDDPGLFDLDVTVVNFTITPDNLDGEPIDNEGHLHLYLDGERIERFFELNHQVEVPAGEHLVEVELSSNSHLPYAVDGAPIRGGATVAGPSEPIDTDEPAEAQDLEPATISEADASQVIVGLFADGNVRLDSDERVEAAVGEVISITIDSDVDEEVHVHGYDLFADVTPSEAATFLFVADTPGRFEIEFESSGVFIAELVVS